jgi:hypothetical protein
MKIALLLVLASVVGAQTTWNGLHFRDTKEKAAAMMESLGLPLVKKSAEGSFGSSSLYSLKIPSVNLTFLFSPELLFDTSGLQEVVLAMDVDKMIAAGPDLDRLTIAALSASDLSSALSSKYGKPIAQSRECQSTATMLLRTPGLVHCEAQWKGESQVVSASWSYMPPRPSNQNVGRFSYILKYQAEAVGI